MVLMAENSISIHTGAVYQIRLQGVLDETWQDSIGDFQIISYRNGQGDETPETLLVGKVPDQAALAGVLNLLYNLGLPLLNVSCLGQVVESLDPSQQA
jgi:hypothetical protein